MTITQYSADMYRVSIQTSLALVNPIRGRLGWLRTTVFTSDEEELFAWLDVAMNANERT